MHALWVEWRAQTVQTTALLALAGISDKVERDAHAAFDEVFSPPPPVSRRRLTPEEREQRRILIARFAAAG